MTAERYVKEVGKLLKCRASKKKEVKRQLLAEINRAAANGEPLEDVLGRMGIPWDYANRYNDNFDKAERKAAKRERALKIWGIVLLVLAVLTATGICPNGATSVKAPCSVRNASRHRRRRS